MTESKESNEWLPTDEEAVDILISVREGKADPDSLRKWLDNLELEADKTPGNASRIECAIRRARVYYKSGYVAEAIGDLEDTLEAARFDPTLEKDPIDEMVILMEKMKRGQTL